MSALEEAAAEADAAAASKSLGSGRALMKRLRASEAKLVIASITLHEASTTSAKTCVTSWRG
jgi:hypothetical protein